MHLKKHILFLSCYLVTHSLVAQKNISGTISDEAGTILPYSNIVLYSLPDSIFTKGDICDDSGHYSMEVPIGFSGYLEVSSLGYFNSQKILDGNLNTYYFNLIQNTELLDEVMIKARKPVFEKKADRVVINPRSNITSLGGTALEMLEKSPGIAIDRVGSNISLNGKQGVLIMVNDKIRRIPMDALFQFLNSISLNDVERIELINNPSAKYEAEGSGGIIHIVVKELNTDGINGNVGLSVNKAHQIGGLGNFGLNWSQGSFHGFVNLSSQLDQRSVVWNENFFIPTENSETSAQSHIERVEKIPIHNLIIGLNYDVNQNTSTELLWTANLRTFSQEGINQGNYQQGQNISRTFTTDLTEKNQRSINTIYGGIKRHWNNIHQLSSSVEYIYSYQDQPSSYINEFENGESEIINANKINPLNAFITKLDYTWSPSSQHNLSIGAKYNTSDFDNQVDIVSGMVSDDVLSNNTQLEESIFSAYTSLDRNFNEKISLRLGMRMEHTMTELLEEQVIPIVDRQYTNWFLNVSGEYDIDDRNRFSFYYNERITRPTFTDLAPFVFYSNPISVFYGNPNLLPGVNHTTGINFSRGSLWLGLEYSWTNDLIGAFQPEYDQDLDILFRFSQNIDRTSMWRLSSSFPIRPVSWMEINNSLFLVMNKIHAEDNFPSFTNPEVMYQGNMNISIAEEFSFGVSGNYFYRQMWGRFFVRPFGNVDFTLSKKFANSSQLSLTLIDAFNTQKWDINEHEDAGYDFQINTFYMHGLRNIRLSFTYPFGSNEIKKRDIDTGSGEEKSRL